MLSFKVKLFSVDPPHSSPHLPNRSIKLCKCISLPASFLTAEELAEPYQIQETLPLAVQINGDFTWEKVFGEKEGKDEEKEKGKAEEKSDKKNHNDKEQSRRKKSKKMTSQNILPSTTDDNKISGNDDSPEKEEPPFSFKDLRFEVPKGAFVAIVGRVGCGKVSLEVTCP